MKSYEKTNRKLQIVLIKTRISILVALGNSVLLITACVYWEISCSCTLLTNVCIEKTISINAC